ncbi:MAG: HD domain-containing protein [Candidatus Paceibacterota bacterium]
MIPLENLENFMRLLHKVQNVKRVARVPDETEYRNTAEHTFEVALLCWYIASANELDLDSGKILKYALAHDVIEGYAGDTCAYDADGQETKLKREQDALQQIENEFSDFPELIATIHAYEKREDAESRFVYALDKFIDPLNCSMETIGALCKEQGISYSAVRKYKDEKIAKSPHVLPYWEELLKKVEKRKDTLFAPEL